MLARFPEVRSIVTRTGRAEVATDPVGPDETEVMVKLRPKDEWTTAHDLDALGEAIKRPSRRRSRRRSCRCRSPSKIASTSCWRARAADVAIKVFGADLTTLKQTADRIGEVVRDIPGCGDWRVQRVLGLPLLEVRPTAQRLARYGISADRVLEVVEASRVGRPAGTIFEGARRFDLDAAAAARRADARGLRRAAGRLVGGRSWCRWRRWRPCARREGPAVINREALQRRVLVEANVRGRDLVSFVNDAQARVAAQVRAAGGRHAGVGRAVRELHARQRAAGLRGAGGAGDHLRDAVPDVRRPADGGGGVRQRAAGVDGRLLALWLRGLPFSIPAAVGFIAVAGVAVLNGVVLAGELVAAPGPVGQPDGGRGARSGAAVFRPVLTTALVAAFGFIPMAISTHAGAEVQRPLATVVIGGIVSSTALGLFVLPIALKRLVRSPDAAGSSRRSQAAG